MADPLDAEIAKAAAEAAEAKRHADAAQAQADRLRRVVELKDARLEALRQAAALRPAFADWQAAVARPASANPTQKRPVGGKGRQPGAISKQWRKVLMTMASHQPSGAPDEQIVDYARSAGLPTTRLKDVRDRMQSYEAHGYVEAVGPGHWRVTELAKAKFRSEPPDAGHDETGPDTDTADAPREASAA